FYKKVNYQKNLRLTGFDVRLNYFGHYQGQLQKIFSPSQEVEALIKNKYGNLLNAPNNVGIQIRVCANNTVPFSGWDYYLSAMKLFSQKSLFIICSDRISWVKKHFPIKGENIIFIDDSDHYLIDFYLLTKCKNLVVGASTFGFWAAFLNENPQKKVVVPSLWLSHHDKRTLEGFPHKWNVYPKDWIVLPVPLVRMVPKDILQYSTISCDW
ncbi:MAG: alpha-1,2-fucosyltransferase, partial [Candidatus Paceibacterota bacterium]